MKNLMYLLAAFMMGLSLSIAKGQSRFELKVADRMPNDLKLNSTGVRTYQVTTDYMDYDLMGNFRSKTRVSGQVTTGLPGDSLRWNNIVIAKSMNEESPFPKGEKQIFMENFSYIQDENIVSQAFFEDIPQADFMIKNLIWDVAALYYYAYWNWNKLELNKPYKDQEINNQEIDLSGAGTFENRSVEVTWMGLSRYQDEICAILKYSTLNNPVKVDMEHMKMNGRSHYWGEIYVSLEDKEIEMATLLEDVVMDLELAGQPQNILGYTVRKIDVSRINAAQNE